MKKARPDIRPEMIEGSPERAADRGRDMLFGDAFASDQPSLGDPHVVIGLVRGFFGGVADARVAWHKAEIDGKAAGQRISDEALRLARIFEGRDAAYSALPFNSPAGLGRFIKAQQEYECADEDAVAIYLNRLATRMLAVMDAFENGRMSDQHAQLEAGSVLQDATRTLLGWPCG